MSAQLARNHRLWSTARARREEARDRRGLARELGDFASSADRLELDTILERSAVEDRHLIEALLLEQDIARMHTPRR